MSEQLFDLYSSTLASNYTPASGTLIVTSASGLPSAGDFSLTILDQTTLAVKLVFKVISRSGTTLTGAPESNDIAAVTGDIVVGSMLTTRSLPSLLSEYDQYGPFASLPTSPRAGYRYKPTDTAFTEMIYDGSPLAWHYFVGAKEVTPPVNADYSWLNQGSATVTANGDIVLATNSEVINIRARTLTATYSVSTSPLVQFSVEMGFYLPIIASANQIWGGMVIKNSGDAKLNTFAPIYSGGFKLEADKWNSVTGFNAAITSIAASNALSQIYWLKFLDDGTNLNFYVSSTGLNWVKITSAARTSFLTSPNTWGFFLLNLSSGYDAVGMRVFHVKTGTS